MKNKFKFHVTAKIGYTAEGDSLYYRTYINEITKFQPLTREEEVNLFKELKITNSQLIKDKLIRHNLLFVVSVAKKYSTYITKSTLTLEDLISEGNAGLCIAIDRFDNTKGIKFISYAIFWIQNQMMKYIEENIKSIRLPHHMQALLNKLKKCERELECNLDRPVEIEEIYDKAKSGGFLKKHDDIKRVSELWLTNQFDQSLNSTVNEESTELWETIENNEQLPDKTFEVKEIKTNINRVLTYLPEYVKNDIIDFYGLNGNKELTVPEIAKKNNKTIEAIRVRIKKGIKNIKRIHQKSTNYYKSFEN